MTLTVWRRTLWGLAIIIVTIAFLITPAHAAEPAVQDAAVKSPGDWLSYLTSLWPIVVTVAGLLITGALLGLATRFVTVVEFKLLKGRVDTLSDTVADHKTRIEKTEDLCHTPPTRIELQEDIADLAERLKGVEVGLLGLQSTGKTTNDYLHLLIEKGLGK